MSVIVEQSEQDRYTEMDAANKKALEILQTQHGTALVTHVFNPSGEKKLTYSEYRERYG